MGPRRHLRPRTRLPAGFVGQRPRHREPRPGHEEGRRCRVRRRRHPGRRPVSPSPGNTLDYALYPSLTNGNTTGKPSDLTVRDVLPPHVSYVAGSGSLAPETDTITDADGQQRQRLTWTLTDVAPNTEMAPITYTAEVSKTRPAAPVVNEVVVASPSDRSDERYRGASAPCRSSPPAAWASRRPPSNRSSSPATTSSGSSATRTRTPSVSSDADLIDVLPFDRDARTRPSTAPRASPQPVVPEAAADESVMYTSAAPARLPRREATRRTSPAGSTTWCAEVDFGTRDARTPSPT